MTPAVINNARRTILNKKREQKNTVVAIMAKKRRIVRILVGENVLVNQAKTLMSEIPMISHQIFLLGLSVNIIYNSLAQ